MFRYLIHRLVLVLAFAGFLAAPASAQLLRPHEPLDPAKAQSLPLTPLSILSGEKTHTFQVEVADTDQTRTTGLMHRNFIAPDRGMLFDFKQMRVVSFWMRNTFIPLDMLFITSDGRVAAIVENATPHSEAGIGPRMPVQAVLEVAGGTAARLGLKTGDVVEHAIFHAKAS